MRVLFVAPFPWPSGQGSQVYVAGQARALAARGHRVTLAVYGGQTGGELPGVELLRARPVPLARFRGGGLHWSRPLADLALAAAVRRRCRAERYDLLHAHNVEGPPVARLARTGLPIVYDLHTRMAVELRHHLPRGVRRLGPALGAALDHVALASSDAGCAISPRAARTLRAAGLPTALVGAGVEALPAPGPPPIPLPRRFICYAGNLDRYQDLDPLYRAAERHHLPLVVVTAGRAAIPSHVPAVRSERFADTIAVLARATVAVIPRVHCDGLPIKLLNQLALGVPSVVCDPSLAAIPGVRWCRPDALGPTLDALLADPPALASLGEAARRVARERFSWDARARELEALYAAVLSRRCRGRTA